MIVSTAHTADLAAATLEAARRLLFEVFVGDDAMTDQDWDHCLGGMHALAREGGDVIAHAAVVQRQLVHGGRALRCGYVEAVAVREDRRRGGHGAAVMAECERIVRAAYDVGALGTTEMAREFYEARGWRQWRGRLSALTPDGRIPTPDEEGGIYVLPATAELDLDGELTCDFRAGDVW
jgi:aminoglycoside 2'-N-acetyltransferase I